MISYDEVKGQEHNEEKEKNEISPLKLQNTDSPFSSEEDFFGYVSFEHITDLLMKPRVTPSLEAHFLFPIIPLPNQCGQMESIS